MMMLSMKVRRRSLWVLTACMAVLVFIGGMMTANLSAAATEAAQGGTAAADVETLAKNAGRHVMTNADRIVFLRGFGWELLSEEPVEIKDVVIPEVFGDVYTNYNELQKRNGYDLSKYMGQTVKQYTYELTNHPSGQAVVAHLMVYQGTVVGGDICDPRLDGFMHGFSMDDFDESSFHKNAES